MKVSIITACFNSAKTIKDTIESVLRQDYNEIEYIIIDGGSTDGTLETIQDYRAGITKLICEKDKGIYDALNKGITLATGELIGILHSDDVFYSVDVVSKIAMTAARHNNIDIFFGSIVQVARDNIDRPIREYNVNGFKAWWLRFGIMPPHPATFIKRAIYFDHGLYLGDGYKIAADYELFVRYLLRDDLTYRRIPTVVTKMRRGGASTSGLKSTLALNREIVKACVQNGIYTNILFLSLKIPYRLIEFVKPKLRLLLRE